MLEKLNDFDWEEAFKYAVKPKAVLGSPVSLASFDREDVEEIIALKKGKNDDTDWLAVFKLSDGRYAALRAWCDYTGWG